MIIRVTFNDNDYQNLLESQFKYGLSTSFLTVKSQYISSESEEALKKYKDISILQDNIFHKLNSEKELNLEEKQQLINIIKEAYKIVIESQYKNIKYYLLNSLTVDIINSFKDKWENGEVLYYFSSADKFIIE